MKNKGNTIPQWQIEQERKQQKKAEKQYRNSRKNKRQQWQALEA